MTTASITTLYSDVTDTPAPEIGAAIKWYLNCYLPRQIDRARQAVELWTDAQRAARIDGDTRVERDAEKNRTTAKKTLAALQQEARDWTRNAGIYLL